MDGADPWVTRKQGFYYFCESRNGGIYISKSRKLTEPKNWTRVWQQPDEGWNSDHLWAPELHYLQGKWYIYYTAGRDGPPFIHQRSGVLEGTGQSPQDPFVEKAQLYTGANRDDTGDYSNIWSIDLTPLELGGRLYVVWSGWMQNRPDDATTQHLFIAEMANPWTISTDRVRISSPVQPWERGEEVDFGINEGPQVLKHEQRVFIIYSTRESWLPHYRLGQLELTGDNPLDPASWRKTGPVFTGTESVHGVGHASFTTSPDGSEHWIVYHSKKATDPGWDRSIRMQPFSWNPDGSPDFGEPVNTGVPLEVPSGLCSQ